MPKEDLEINFTGTDPVQDSKTVTGKSGKFRVELSWSGYYEGIPRNPEMHIFYLSSDEEKVILESYKNFDLQKHAKQESDDCQAQSISENDDNIGVRTADEVVYLSCDYLRVTTKDCSH